MKSINGVRSLQARLTHWLNRQLPHALVSPCNPVFAHELRQIEWPCTPAALKKFTVCVVIGVALLLTGLWLLDHRIFDFVLFANLGVMLMLDVRYVLLAINHLHHQFESGRWDDVRLTLLPESDILMAQYAAVQVRVWRMMAFEMGLRLALCLITLLGLLGILREINLRSSTFHEILFIASAIAATIPLIRLTVFESLWRMRLIVAIGIRVGAQIRHTTFGPLAGLGALLLMRMVQIITLVLVIFPFVLVVIYPLSFFAIAIPPIWILNAVAIFIVVKFFYVVYLKPLLKQAFFFAFRSQ